MDDTHAHTQTHPWWSIKARAYNALDAPQGVPSTYVIAGIDMRANADLWGGKGERKELPGHRPGRREARASASRAAIGQRSGNRNRAQWDFIRSGPIRVQSGAWLFGCNQAATKIAPDRADTNLARRPIKFYCRIKTQSGSRALVAIGHDRPA